MIDFSHSEISAYYGERVPGLAQPDKREWRGPCPIHNGQGDNFAVDSETGLANCHSQCGRGWDMISLEMELRGLDFVAAKASLFEAIGRPKPSWEDRDVERAFDYTDENGQLVYQVVRKFGKKFAQRKPNGNGGWVWSLAAITAIPYRLPELRKSPFCAIVEGEKDADNLSRLGIVATCNNGGAGNFKPELAKWFEGKKVAIFPDNDEPGQKHALAVAELLKPVAKWVKIVELPNLAPKGDVSDWIAGGGTREQLRDLCQNAAEWTPEWRFAVHVPNEQDKYIHTLAVVVDLAGGVEAFWRLPKQEGFPTPWKKLTQALGGGMRKGEVYVIGANQGQGKTSLALQFAAEGLKRAYGVLLMSMEMGPRDVFQRLISMEARVDLQEFRDLQRNSTFSLDLNTMKEYLERETRLAEDWRLTVSTKSSVTPEYLLGETARIRNAKKLDLVIVDHMQLMGSDHRSRSEYEKFTEISRALKSVAVELDLPVLLVSQTSRNNSHDRRTELEVSDLRGSGAIEEDAAGVMLLYADPEDRDRRLKDGTFARGPVKTWLKLGKNRYGPQGVYFPLLHFKTCTRFEYEVDWHTKESVAS